MTALLAGGLAAMVGFTYLTLSRRAEDIVRDRLTHAAKHVAGTAEAALAQRAAALRAVAADTAVRRLLRAARGDPASAVHPGSENAGPGIAAVRSALARLMPPHDSTLPVELWDARGRVVAFVGPELPAVERPAALFDRLTEGVGDTLGAVRFGPLQPVGGRTRFWAAAPVVAGGRRVGFVAQPRYVSGPRDATQMLRELTREEVTLYTRNADGTAWTVAPGTPASAPSGRDSAGGKLSYSRPGVGRMLAAESPVAGTSWVMVLESPERWVLARPLRTLRMLVLLGLVLTAAGAVLSWVVSRRITRPLVALTAAAEEVARGTYEHAVVGAGRDEIGRLAASFDGMARQVAKARRELEGRAAEAHGAAEGLARANRQLRGAMAEAEQARADAERASRAKSDFLAMMSHELRTPLNAIGGYAQLLEMGLHGPVTDEQRDALTRIGRSQTHLLTLINDVLNFARIDAGQVEYAFDDVPIHETLAGLEALVAPQVRARSLAFDYRPCAPGLVVRADPDKLRQVVLNLLANAIKYTPEGGTVTMECDADERRVYVHVRDTGPGIPAERLPFIFEPFVQGERALNRPNEGVGLGLAISRDLARGMGGEITVVSEPGKGSTFTVAIPRVAVASAPSAAVLPALSSGVGRAATRV